MIVIITVLLIILIVVASIPAAISVCLALRIYKASRRCITGAVAKTEEYSPQRKQRRKPYRLEQDGLMSLEELASNISPQIETIGETWRSDNEWDNAVKIEEVKKHE